MTVADLIERLRRFNPDDTVTIARVVHARRPRPERVCRNVETVDAVRVGDVRHVALYAGRAIDRRVL